MSVKGTSLAESLPVRPKSATPVWIGCLALLGFLSMLSYSVMQAWHPYAVMWMSSLGILIPALGYEAVVSRAAMRPRPENNKEHTYRLNLKRIGLLVTFAGWAFVGWLFPYYHEYGTRIWEMFTYPITVLENSGWSQEWIIGIGIIALVLADRYLAYTDRCLVEPWDGLFTLGAWVTRQKSALNPVFLKQHVLQWTVKIFFLPLMLSSMYGNIVHISANEWSELFSMAQDPYVSKTGLLIHNFGALKLLLFTIDLGFAMVGYACTLKLFGTHTRSAESTLWGWMVCVACYAPFHRITNNAFLKFKDNVDYDILWMEHPTICVMWVVSILVLLVIYTFATVQFGVRFSNLTHRGILTTGVYGWSKHPAYISKNTMWWIIIIPFLITIDRAEALIFGVHLALRNLIYYYRAKTEEKHLSQDETYRQYAAWIAEHGLFARIRCCFRPNKAAIHNK